MSFSLWPVFPKCLGHLATLCQPPMVTHHPSGTVPLTVVPLALGPGAETISSSSGPSCALSQPLTLLPTLLHRDTGLEPPDLDSTLDSVLGICHSLAPWEGTMDWESADGILSTILSHL